MERKREAENGEVWRPIVSDAMPSTRPTSFGWQRDAPDCRDYTFESDRKLRQVADTLQLRATEITATKVDLRSWCPPVEDQGVLSSSSAHACLTLWRYCIQRTTGYHPEPSRRFLFDTTRRTFDTLCGWPVGLRATFKALVRFGAPPEKYWPYHTTESVGEPPAFLFLYREQVKALRYVRVSDHRSADENLLRLKACLVAGLPIAFGFYVYSSISASADIPVPTIYDSVLGGQAVVAVGYDDERRIRSHKGAFLVQSSWGESWGEHGFGWLPYNYVNTSLAADFWTLVEPTWADNGGFARE